jgi:integrase
VITAHAADLERTPADVSDRDGYRTPSERSLAVDDRLEKSSLSRSAGADMKLLQVTMGHASIMVTAHIYADLYDSDVDRVANALDGLGD